MGWCFRRLLWVLVAFLCQGVLYAQEHRPLKFIDGPEQPVVDNVYERIVSSDVLERSIEAKLISFGKANPLSGELLEQLKMKDPPLYRQARQIRSAFRIAQGDSEFYLRGFATISLSRLKPGKPVKCRIVLIEVRSVSGLSYIPLIRTVQKTG
jgi:hypothetical protein